MNLFEWMTVCAKDLRLDGIEIGNIHLESMDEDYIRKVKRIAVDLHLTIGALTMATDFGNPSGETREKELERVEVECQVAAALGAPVLCVTAGEPGCDRGNKWGELVRCLKIACLLAEREGVVLAVENQPPGGFIESFGDIDRLIHETDSHWLRLNLNPANFSDGMESLEKCMLYGVHIRAKMNNIAEDGYDTAIDYPGLARLTNDMNYRGFITVYYQGEEDEMQAVQRGTGYIRSLFTPPGSGQ